jgi:hypothetical protein
MKTTQLTVAKIEESELQELSSFLRTIGDKVKGFSWVVHDSLEFYQELGKLVCETFPTRPAFVAPLNLSILLANYQDKESDILAHPKWINDLNNLLDELNKYLDANPKNYIGSGSILHNKIKEYINES